MLGLLAIPLQGQRSLDGLLLDVAATLYQRKQVGLGAAARIAGLSHDRMIEELGHRHIPMNEADKKAGLVASKQV